MSQGIGFHGRGKGLHVGPLPLTCNHTAAHKHTHADALLHTHRWTFGVMGQELGFRVRSMMMKNMLFQEVCACVCVYMYVCVFACASAMPVHVHHSMIKWKKMRWFWLRRRAR